MIRVGGGFSFGGFRAQPAKRSQLYRRKKRVRAPRLVRYADEHYEPAPTPLPTATLRVADKRVRFGLELRHELAALHSWLAPRAVPITVAILGMLALLGATTYLSDLATLPVESP